LNTVLRFVSRVHALDCFVKQKNSAINHKNFEQLLLLIAMYPNFFNRLFAILFPISSRISASTSLPKKSTNSDLTHRLILIDYDYHNWTQKSLVLNEMKKNRMCPTFSPIWEKKIYLRWNKIRRRKRKLTSNTPSGGDLDTDYSPQMNWALIVLHSSTSKFKF
jgi:hypothetical protein